MGKIKINIWTAIYDIVPALSSHHLGLLSLQLPLMTRPIKPMSHLAQAFSFTPLRGLA